MNDSVQQWQRKGLLRAEPQDICHFACIYIHFSSYCCVTDHNWTENMEIDVKPTTPLP